jgi:hypothetical protein
MNSVERLSRIPARTSGAGVISLISILLLAAAGCGGGSADSSHSPAIAISSAPSAVALQQSAQGSATITVTSNRAFSGTVSLAASGLPSGVTATFSPSSTDSQSTVTFTVSGSAPTGTGTITITGTSGNLTATTAINFAVLAAPTPGGVATSFFALNNVSNTDNPATDGMFYGAVGHPIRLAWPYIETSRGNYDFSFYDQYAAMAPKQNGGAVAVMDLTLGMTPSWAVADQSTCRQLNGGVSGCQAPPDNVQDWQNFITALVQHYNGTTAPHILYYEIWNEWNTVDPQNGFWSGSTSQLVSLQTTACSIIHQNDHYSLVVTPSTVGDAATPADAAPAALASYFSATGSNGLNGTSCPGSSNGLIDAVSFHGNLGIDSITPYPLPGDGCSQSGCNGTIVQISNSYRQLMNGSGLQSTPLLDTEGGFESANITDSDQRAAWLAQFYALEAGLYNSDQLQWVSWFTWGTNVSGQIENANGTPNEGGIAYNQLFDWLVGRVPSACTQSGTIWTCQMTGSSGYQAEIIWDDSQTCNNGQCTTSNQTAPSWATQYRDIAGNVTQITAGTVPVGLKPIIVEN